MEILDFFLEPFGLDGLSGVDVLFAACAIIGTALFLIYFILVVITGDNWQEIMRSAAIQEPYCTSGSELERLIAEGFRPNDPTYTKGDCGSTLGAMIFFDLAYLLGFNILRSLFIAVLMESFFAFKGGAGFMISPYHVEQVCAHHRLMVGNDSH